MGRGLMQPIRGGADADADKLGNESADCNT